jgi:hypothetical protein
MNRLAMAFTVPAARALAAAALLLRAAFALASPARATMGAETGHPRPTGPSRYWPNPSSTENGRPWPPAPPHW